MVNDSIELEIEGYTCTGEKVHLIDTLDKSCFAKYNIHRYKPCNPTKGMVATEILRRYSHLFCFNIVKCVNPWKWGYDWEEDMCHCMPIEKDVFNCKWDYLNGSSNIERLECRLDDK